MNLSVDTPNMGNIFIKNRLHIKKVLIVFDDVTCLEQIEGLIGDFKYLGSGSRIIITTRDSHVLKNCGVDHIHKVVGLFDREALMLFSRYAFKKNHPMLGYKNLSSMVINYAKGVPLALKVLGSFLFAREKQDWKSALKKLKKFPHKSIQKVLQISYDGLDDEENDIFLDIACFFKGWDRYLVKDILDASGFSTQIGIRVLVDKSLLTITSTTITMHDLLQEMGREIVRQESVNDPSRRSRLWHHKDIYHVLTKNTGTKAIQGICLDISKISNIHFNPCAFEKMHNLRFFKLYSSMYGDVYNRVHGFEGLSSVFNGLRYLHWDACPLKSLSNFHPKNLVVLDMPYSSIEQLWDGDQHLVNLKHLNLSYSNHLKKIPNLSGVSNLKELILKGCTSLFEINTLSIQNLNKLVILNLKDCKSLSSLPTSLRSRSLREVNLSGCSNLKALPQIPCNVEKLYLDGTTMKELPLIEHPSKLAILSLMDCSRLENLPSSICKSKSLTHLNVAGCSMLEKLPDDLGSLEALTLLEAKDTSIKELPSSIIHLNKLDTLHISRWKGHEPVGLVLPSLSGLRCLTNLSLSGCRISKLPNSFGCLSSLRRLYLARNDFESIPASIIDISFLEYLDLSYCEKLQSLPKLPKVQNMQACNCPSLEALPDLSFLFLPWLTRVNVSNCFNLDQIKLRDRVENALQNVHIKKYFRKGSGTNCFPGNDIPEWFSFQSAGSSITLNLPPGWNNEKFLGFAMCAIVSFPDDYKLDRSFSVRCECKGETNVTIAIFGELSVWYNFYCPVSDHVFLTWQARDYCDVDLIYKNKASMEFHVDQCMPFLVEGYKPFHVEDSPCKVKKCGIHLLYAQNCLESEGSRGSSNSEREEEERNHRPRD